MINPKEFMDEPEELHAFVIGLCEIICPWPPYRTAMSEARAKEIQDEYHYYVLGRATGIYTWLVLAYIIKVLFF